MQSGAFKTTEVDFLLIGDGLASATAAKTLREQEAEGAVVILAAESLLPYHRPPLTKGFLLGKRPHASLLVLNEAYFWDHGVRVLLGTRALAVEPQKRRVCTDSAGDFTHRKLLIATGGSPRRLKVPGAELPGIFYLRTLADAEALQRAMAKTKRAAVIGSSFIAMELAASFAEQGIKTTLIARGEDRPSGEDQAGYPSAATPGSLPAARRGAHGSGRAAAYRPDQAQPPLPPDPGRCTPTCHHPHRPRGRRRRASFQGLRLLTRHDRDTPARGLSDRGEEARPRGGTARLSNC